MTDMNDNNAEAQQKENTLKKRSPVFAMFLFVILLGLAGMSFYNFRNNTLLSTQVSAIKTDISAFSVFEPQITGIDESIKRLESELDKTVNELSLLDNSLTGLYDEVNSDNQDWAIEEIEQLIIIAMHQLQLASGVPAAIAAMEVADHRLKALNHPNSIAIRRQITSDINRLKSVNDPDLTGLALTLIDIASQAERLPLKQGTLEQPDEAEDPTVAPLSEDQEASLWQQFTSAIWSELKGLIAITRQNENTLISLLPDQKYYLFQNLKLELTIARLAILQRDTRHLHSSIDSIISWLDRYFETEDAAVRHVVDTLSQMKNIELVPEVPDLNASLDAVRSYTRSSEE